MTVSDNVGFGLKMARSRRRSRGRIEEAPVSSAPEFGYRAPGSSGGQQQRVVGAPSSTGRRFCSTSRSSVDRKLRHRLQIELAQIPGRRHHVCVRDA
jgi:ABC-type Fe3+/spermidine/putrescine transport system ATPase subunit